LSDDVEGTVTTFAPAAIVVARETSEEELHASVVPGSNAMSGGGARAGE
jgi:precorrin-3B methylase